jgi:hypothetical protein
MSADRIARNGRYVMIRLPCPRCRIALKFPDNAAGRKVSCPECGRRLRLRVEWDDPEWEDREDASHEPAARGFWRTVLGAFLPFLSESHVRQPQEGRHQTNPDGTEQKHSGYGIASFLIAVVVGGLNAFLLLAVAVNAASSGDRIDRRIEILEGGVSIATFNCISVPVCLVGVGLAVVAFTVHPRRNHGLTWFGLFVNGVVLIGVLLASLAGAARHY